jgi:class 3 adenylate cyclase
MDIVVWLRSLGLGKYEAVFRENEIDETVLTSLTEEHLKQLGVTALGHRLKLLDAIAALRAEASIKAPLVATEPAPAATPNAAHIAEAVGERRHLTVMFCDLVGSTSISAGLDAEDWRDLVGAYLDAASAAVTEMGGHVAKKLGDGLMALFGYPVAQENDAERAARAALAIQRALAEVNRKNAAAGKPALNARVGIEIGPVVIDAAGEIYGDAPNVAARVQALAEPGTVVVTAHVQRQIVGLFVAEERGSHQLKGVPEPLTLFKLVRASGGGRRAEQRHLTPLVGRDEEIAVLMRRWERARQGEGQLVLIVGEPGLGKSRLVEEFHARLRDTPHTWAEWSCSQLLQNTPLHPIADWGRQRFGGADMPAEKRLGDLENLLDLVKLDPGENAALLAPLLDIPLPPERALALPPEELRRRQLAALTNLIITGARAQPAVLAIEDLHWADPTTLDLLRGIAERGALTPLLVLTTARPEFRPPWGMRSHHSTISLAPLDRAQVRHMVGELAARHALPKEVIDGVTERTGGVPLFVEEVTRLLLERGEQGGIQAIPPTLQQSFTARLDRLGPAREVAQIAAVIGRGFTYPLVRAVAKVEDEALQTALERLAEADILLVQGLPPESEYRFKHALIQDAAYENLLKSRRQALHRRTGEVLRDQFAATAAAAPELLAHHFTQAGLTEAAIEWWGTAGQRSLARSALVEAAEQLKRALDQIATLPAMPALRREEIKLEVAFANVLALTGDLVGGKEHYDRALAIYDPAEHRPLTTRSGRDVGVTLLSFRSSCVWQLGYPVASRNDAERAVKNARELCHATTLMYALNRAATRADSDRIYS